MKRLISLLLVCAMLFSVCVFSVSAEESLVIASGTADVTADESFTYEWVAEENGTLTVKLGEAKPGWRTYLVYGSGDMSFPTSGTSEFSVSYDVVAGESHTVYIIGYDEYNDERSAVTVDYEISFTASGSSSTVKEEYEVCYDMMLALGENELTLSQNAVTTIYELWPDEAGIYRFEASDPNALVGYWGSGSFFVQDLTENKTNVLEFTLENAGPSIMVGVSGVDSCTLNVTMIGSAVVTPAYESYDYVNEAYNGEYILPEGVNPSTFVNVVDANEDVAYLGDDGYYHLNSTDGPVVFVNLGPAAPYGAPFTGAASYGVAKGCLYDENGDLTAIVNYVPAWEEYVNGSDNYIYPLTADLITMYCHVGENLGWYDKDSVLESYIFGNATVSLDSAWMFACCYDADYTGEAANSDAVVYGVNSFYNECTGTYDVTIDMSNNNLGLWASVMYLKYDGSLMTPVSVKNGNVWDENLASVDLSVIDNTHKYDWAHNSVYMCFMGLDLKNAATAVEGTVATISFELAEGADYIDAVNSLEFNTW